MGNLRKLLNLSLAVIALTIVACGKGKAVAQAAAPSSATAPEVITFTKPALYPEGVEYDDKGRRFLVTSLREGVVGEVSDDGTYKIFAQDPNFVSAIGLRLDAGRDRLLVCNSDPGASVHTKKETQGKLAGLGVFQMSTGKLIKYIDLAKIGGGGGHFCNDIAIDSAGNAYVTDSFSPIIYKVDGNYNATVLINNKRFGGEGFNLNGLVVKEGYLLVAKDNDGSLFKIPLDKPELFSQVKIAQSLIGADGLLWAPDGDLVLIANAKTNKVFKLNSTDNWTSASVAAVADTGDVFATTGTVRDGKVYTLYAMLHVLFNPATKTHIDKYDIRQQKL